MEKTYAFYFVQTVDIPANASKMESGLLDFLRNTREHSVLELNALLAFVITLEHYQDELLKQNPRLKPVGIQLSEPQYHGLRRLTIGRISVNLIAVKSIER